MPAILKEADVRHVAHLARLTLTDEEVHRYAEQLSSVLGFVEKLSELNTDDVPPSAHASPVGNVFREDQGRASLTPEKALQNAPQRQGDFFKVPQVLDQGGAQ